MAIRDIVTGTKNEALRKKAREVKKINNRTLQLLDDMRETLHHDQGVGLAAPQVGVLRRIAIIEYDDTYFEVINPVITKQSGEETDDEGCLSVPGIRGLVKRPKMITVDYTDREGNEKSVELEDTMARIFCHEIDHLDGVLFVDKMERETTYDDVESEEMEKEEQ